MMYCFSLRVPAGIIDVWSCASRGVKFKNSPRCLSSNFVVVFVTFYLPQVRGGAVVIAREQPGIAWVPEQRRHRGDDLILTIASNPTVEKLLLCQQRSREACVSMCRPTLPPSTRTTDVEPALMVRLFLLFFSLVLFSCSFFLFFFQDMDQDPLTNAPPGQWAPGGAHGPGQGALAENHAGPPSSLDDAQVCMASSCFFLDVIVC